jgi:hypothetical protein
MKTPPAGQTTDFPEGHAQHHVHHVGTMLFVREAKSVGVGIKPKRR